MHNLTFLIFVTTADSNQQTPLSWAAVQGHTGIVKLLLDIGKVSPDTTDSNQQIPLSWAAGQGHT